MPQMLSVLGDTRSCRRARRASSEAALDAHEDAVGDALARSLPVGPLVFVSQPNYLAAEDVGGHSVLVAKVRDATAVPLHAGYGGLGVACTTSPVLPPCWGMARAWPPAPYLEIPLGEWPPALLPGISLRGLGPRHSGGRLSCQGARHLHRRRHNPRHARPNVLHANRILKCVRIHHTPCCADLIWVPPTRRQR